MTPILSNPIAQPPRHSKRSRPTSRFEERHSRSTPELVFSPLAWLKWQFLCHVGSTEIAGFGLSSPHQPLYLDDILVVRQRASSVSVAFDDHAVADLFDDMADREIPPQRFARIWLHTHPGASVTPSGTDEETFTRCFGSCDWAVMAILGRTGRTYARLRFNAGPGSSLELPVTVDWTQWPTLAMEESFPHAIGLWLKEAETLIEPDEFRLDLDWFGPFGLDTPIPFSIVEEESSAIHPQSCLASEPGSPNGEPFDFFDPRFHVELPDVPGTDHAHQ